MTTRPSLINDRLKSTKHGHYKRSGKGLVLRVRVTRTSILRLYTLDPPLPPLLFSRVTWHGCCHPFVEFEIQQPCADSYPLPPILRQICTINGVKFNFQNFDYRSECRDVPFPGYILFLRFALLRTTTRFILIAHPLFILYHHPARSRAPVNLDSRFRIAWSIQVETVRREKGGERDEPSWHAVPL